MTNRDMFTLLAGIQSCGDLKGLEFAKACSKNARLLSAECDDLRAGLKGEAFQAYAKAMQEPDADQELLRAEHPEAAKLNAEFELLLDKPAEVKLHKIADELVPKDISVAQYGAIVEMIEE